MEFVERFFAVGAKVVASPHPVTISLPDAGSRRMGSAPAGKTVDRRSQGSTWM
jgi:hypothetical protein